MCGGGCAEKRERAGAAVRHGEAGAHAAEL